MLILSRAHLQVGEHKSKSAVRAHVFKSDKFNLVVSNNSGFELDHENLPDDLPTITYS